MCANFAEVPSTNRPKKNPFTRILLGTVEFPEESGHDFLPVHGLPAIQRFQAFADGFPEGCNSDDLQFLFGHQPLNVGLQRDTLSLRLGLEHGFDIRREVNGKRKPQLLG
jgi:hypothetical protein